MPKINKDRSAASISYLEQLTLSDPVIDEQIYRLLIAFARISDEKLRENIIARAEWMARHPEVARKYLERLAAGDETTH